MSYSDIPTREDISRLLDALRPRIVATFLEFHVPDTDAVFLLSDVLIQLGCRWGRIKDREGWLLNRIRTRAKAWAEGTGKELNDDEAPGPEE